MSSIRAIALGIFQHQGRLLVFEGYDAHKRQTFYRPLGGGIQFGERGAQAVTRELYEEIGAEVVGLHYLGALENIFTCNGVDGHEIVLLYAGELADPVFYTTAELVGHEDDGTPIKVLWKALQEFNCETAPLYPDGLLAWLRGNPEAIHDALL